MSRIMLSNENGPRVGRREAVGAAGVRRIDTERHHVQTVTVRGEPWPGGIC